MIHNPEDQDQDSLILLLSDLERICLDAYLFNKSNKLNAYKASKGITGIEDTDILNKRATNWLNGRAVKAYIDKHKNSIVLGSETSNFEENEDNQIDKSSIIMGVEKLIRSTNDPKLKADLYMKLNDLKGYKKDTTKQDEQQIRFYLPQRCDTCDYKAEYQAHNKQNE